MKIWTNKDVWGRSYLLKVGSQWEWYDTVDYDDDHVDGEEHPGEDCDDNDDDHDVDEEHLGEDYDEYGYVDYDDDHGPEAEDYDDHDEEHLGEDAKDQESRGAAEEAACRARAQLGVGKIVNKIFNS